MEILFEVRGPVGIATFHRPEVLNAFRQRTFERLLELLAEVGADGSLRVLLLTGSGRAFSSGIDLRELQGDGLGQGEPEVRATLERTQEITRRLVDLPQVVIAAVNGPAVGFGAELSLGADLRVASEAAAFAFPEVRRAVFLTNGATWLLPRLVGVGRAMEWLVTGREISASEALSSGLVTEVLPADRLLEVAMERAERIAAHAPVSLRLVKRALNRSFQVGLEEALRTEIEGVLRCRESEDWEEGVRAFLEKRPPRFTGL
ncbi:MAG: enoyl-CoA hydratase/isomerase family protein [Gemmatimonadota bacterium]